MGPSSILPARYMEQRWNDTDRRTRRETCPSATLSTTNPTWTAVDAKPGLHGEKPAANRLSYDRVRIQRASSDSGHRISRTMGC
jgi:hypothetical protein